MADSKWQSFSNKTPNEENAQNQHDLPLSMDDGLDTDSEMLSQASMQEQHQTILSELKDAEKRVKDYWDKLMRMEAEMRNVQSRADQRVSDAHKFALKKFAEELLPVLDSLERSLEVKVEDTASVQALREGIELTLQIFTDVLQKNGISVINPIGEKFNPELHEAMSLVDAPHAEVDTIVAVMQKGYLLNNRLIRPARVMVAKSK